MSEPGPIESREAAQALAAVPVFAALSPMDLAKLAASLGLLR